MPRRPKRIESVAAGAIQAGDERLALTVRLDPRARRLTLRLIGDQVRVTCPSKRHVKEAVALAKARGAWLAERRAAQPVRRPFAVGQTIPVMGAPRTIRLGENPRAAARLIPDTIITGGADDAGIARRVEALLRREAKIWLTARADHYARQLGLPPCPVTVRETRSRWGSCSVTPALSFSWRLALAPPAVADYVAAHEVAHRRHMDHSAAFWAVVGTLYPDYEEQAAWLRDHGAELHAYG